MLPHTRGKDCAKDKQSKLWQVGSAKMADDYLPATTMTISPLGGSAV